MAQQVLDESRPLFFGVNNNELLLALRLRLDKYARWQEPGFRETILQFILHECQSRGSICLREEDLGVLWK